MEMNETYNGVKCPDKFKGTMSVAEFIKTVDLTDAQVATLIRMKNEGKLW